MNSLLAAMVAVGGAAGCALEGVEDPGDPSDPGGGDPVGGNEEPETVTCSAVLSVSGTIELSQEQPVDRQGCWPVGTWTIDVAVTDPGDCPEVPVAEQYVYEVVLTDPADTDGGWEYIYPAEPDSELVYMKVTEGGGRCQGSFEHYSADGKQWTQLRPFEETDNVLAGTGEFEISTVSGI